MMDSSTDPRDVLATSYIDLYAGEAAAALETAPTVDIVELLGAQSTQRAASLCERLPSHLAAECLMQLDDEAARKILAAMNMAHAALALGQLDAATRDRRLQQLPPRLAKELAEIMIYPPDTAGHFMDTRVLSFERSLTVSQALARLRRRRVKGLQQIIVVDTDNRLVGMIPLVAMVPADPADTLESLIAAPPPQVHAMAPREEVVEILTKTNTTVLPVVNLDGQLLGVIRQEALIQAVQEEATAGVQTMVGVSKDERALSSPLFAVRKRLPWLNINLLTAFLAAAVVGLFESTIAQFTALAVLLPVVAGQSGNTGAQALAVTMRGLALREIRLSNGRRVLLKEASVGALNGLAVAAVTALGVFVWSRSLGLTFVIGLAMVLSMVIAGIAGAAIPLVLSAVGQDPAQSGSIILTTVTDIAGFLSFLGLATVFSTLL
jgi:magnesium transporter